MKKVSIVFFCLIISSLIVWGCHPQTMISPEDIAYPPLSFSLPEPERVELNNGIILYILEDHELPLINVSAVIRTGSIYDPVGKEGLAEITGSVMRTGGTKDSTGDTIDETLDNMAGIISVSMGKESATAELSILKKDIDRGIEIFSSILMNPIFEKSKLNRAKALKMEALRRIYDNPQELAFREFVRLIYRGNPRGRLSSVASVKNITQNDCIQFHQRFFYPGNIMIAITGDITTDEAVAVINRHFARWNVSGRVKQIPLPHKNHRSSINYIYKDVPQSIVIVGQFAPGKKDRDYYSFEVLDFVIGSGGFRSRIFGEVRSKRGLAYSAGSFYSPRNDYGVFGAYAMTKTSSTVQSLSVIKSILDAISREQVSDAELTWAKKSINSNFIFSFSSAEKIAMQQMMLEYYDLPKDFLTKYSEHINEVSREDLQGVAAKYLQEPGETILVVGNKANFDKPLSTFGEVDEIKIK